MEQALAYTQTEDYSGRSVYMGAWNVSDPEKGELRLPLVAPNPWTFSFAQPAAGKQNTAYEGTAGRFDKRLDRTIAEVARQRWPFLSAVCSSSASCRL